MFNQVKKIWKQSVLWWLLRAPWFRTRPAVIIIFFAFVFCATVIMTLSTDPLPFFIREGEISQKDIKADRNYEIVDHGSTEQLRRRAIDSVLPVYDWDLKIGETITERLGSLFDRGLIDLQKELGGGAGRQTSLSKLSPEARLRLKTEIEQAFEIVFDDRVFDLLVSIRFDPNMTRELLTAFKDTVTLPIIQGRGELELDRLPTVTLRYFQKGDYQSEESWTQFDQVIGIDAAKALFVTKVKERRNLQKSPLLRLHADELAILTDWLSHFIVQTLQYNVEETELRREKAAAAVKEVVVQVKLGEVIVREGDRLEQGHVMIVEGIREKRVENNSMAKWTGAFLLIAIVFLSVYVFGVRYLDGMQHLTPIDLYFLEIAVLLALLVFRMGAWFAGISRDALPVSVLSPMLHYAIPIAGVCMLVRMVLNAQVSLIFTILISFLGGVYLGNNLLFALYAFMVGIVGMYGVAEADRRLSIMKAGALSGLFGMVILSSYSLLSVFGVGEVRMAVFVAMLVFSLIAGLLSGVLSLSLAPLAESLFGYTTDIKLLELANLDHPLLREMVLRAPGTYHHSHLVGLLSEAGARAIGANALLARVACYYHDIGKMKRPDYFIENQASKGNRHDHLSPSESAAIIAAHVQDGLDMAHKYQLPPCIVDMIPQHQGTKIMTFFYEKAKAALGPGEVIDERFYRYPGPRPQSREAGIIMLADATEAAVRSLPQKTPENIDATVKKIMNRHFSDGQFDECELTLKDLHSIAASFVTVLQGIYHNRIPYPESKDDRQDEDVVR